MTNFTPTKFNHHQTEEYGEHKKVTTKLLTETAENEEYLYNKINTLRQNKTHTTTLTRTPTRIQTSTNTNTTNITTKTTIDDVVIQPQVIHEISSGETSATITTPTVTIPDGKKLVRIKNPVITPEGTSCTKKIIGTSTTLTYTFKAVDVEYFTGSQDGTITSTSLVQEYLTLKHITTLPNVSTLSNLKTWIFSNAEFMKWLAQKKQIVIFDTLGQEPFDDYFYLPYKVYSGTSVKKGSTSINGTWSNQSFSISNRSDVSANDTLTVVYVPLYEQYTSDELVVCGGVLSELGQSENTVLLPLQLSRTGLTVYKNDVELVQSVDYAVSETSNNTVITLLDADEEDVVEVLYEKSYAGQDFRLVYELSRTDTSSNVKVLYYMLTFE